MSCAIAHAVTPGKVGVGRPAASKQPSARARRFAGRVLGYGRSKILTALLRELPERSASAARSWASKDFDHPTRNASCSAAFDNASRSERTRFEAVRRRLLRAAALFVRE